VKTAVMLSGTGSTYATIANAIEDGRLPGVEVELVISSKANAGGVDKAQSFGHAVHVIDPKNPNFHQELNSRLESMGVDLIVLAGFMHLWKLSPQLEGKVINTHPSLIPAFCGKGMYGHHVHQAVIERGAKVSGCTVHLVDGAYDHGRILEQRVVNVESVDNPDTLAEKVQVAEKALLLHVIRNWPQYR